MKTGLIVLLMTTLAIQGSAFAGSAEERLLAAENKALRAQIKILQPRVKWLEARLVAVTEAVTILKAVLAKTRAEVAELKAKSGPTTRPAAKKSVSLSKGRSLPPGFCQVSKGIVRVLACAKIDRIELQSEITGEASGRSKDDLLCIMVIVTNLSNYKKLQYRTWGAGAWKLGGASATLKDDHGNRYSAIHFGVSTIPVCRVDKESIYPEKHITDVLVFEPPVAKAKILTLTLPLSALGEKGQIVLTIPVSGIGRQLPSFPKT